MFRSHSEDFRALDYGLSGHPKITYASGDFPTTHGRTAVESAHLPLEVNHLLHPLIRVRTLSCHQLFSLVCAAVEETTVHLQGVKSDKALTLQLRYDKYAGSTETVREQLMLKQ